MKYRHLGPILVRIFLVSLLAGGGRFNGASAYTKYTSRLSSAVWSGSTTWLKTGSGTPVTYHILSGHTVELDVTPSNTVDTLIIDGTFKFDNFKTLDITVGGAIILGVNGIIEGGNAHSSFTWASSTVKIKGPYNGSNKIDNGPRFATRNSAVAAGGDPQGSFLFGTLPIDLIAFDARPDNDLVKVTWTASGHSLGDVFVIQTSADGKQFTEAGRVDVTQEGGVMNYAFNVTGFTKSLYLKLQIISQGVVKDLTFNYIRHQSKTLTSKISVFPSIIKPDQSELNMLLAESGTYSVSVFNDLGMELYSGSKQAYSDNQIVSLSDLLATLRVGGIYYLSIRDENGKVTNLRLMKL